MGYGNYFGSLLLIVFFPILISAVRGIMVGCLTYKLWVVGSNPAADILFSTQIAVLMQNLGLILFKNHELCSLAHFGTVKLYMG